ncbi:hypothetical protein GX563_07450 [Candidatus Bathyarchaeota archaeon]|nr:hypothetical protein [Candidatus Bathyarchaeota archaeon]
MNPKLVVTVLAVALIISAAANIYIGVQTFTVSVGGDPYKTRVDMTSVLSEVQAKVDEELTCIGQSLIYAAEQLSSAGLTGAQVDVILSALAANSSYIIDAGTQDMNCVMAAIQPSTYSGSIGKNVGEQKWLNTNPDGAITPTMTPVIPLIEDLTGVAMAAPVFNSNKQQIGTVSVVFNPQELLSDAITAVTTDPQYEFTAIQTNGAILFDSMGAEVGTNLFDETSNTEILTVGSKIAQTSSGYSTYNISESLHKQCYWTTISQYSQDWRLIIHHTI